MDFWGVNFFPEVFFSGGGGGVGGGFWEVFFLGGGGGGGVRWKLLEDFLLGGTDHGCPLLIIPVILTPKYPLPWAREY